MLIRSILTTVLLISSFAVLAKPPALPDQFGEPMSLDDFSGNAILVIAVNARKARHIGRWEEALRKDYPGLVSIRITDPGNDPKATYEQIAKMLRKRAPQDVRILIDMENQWANEYELDTDEPCLLLLDADHNLVSRFRGRAKQPLISDVMTALENYFPAGPEQSE